MPEIFNFELQILNFSARGARLPIFSGQGSAYGRES